MKIMVRFIIVLLYGLWLAVTAYAADKPNIKGFGHKDEMIF